MFFNATKTRKAAAIIDYGQYKGADVLNGYENGVYNVAVTVFDYDTKARVDNYLNNAKNIVLYDKIKGFLQGAASRTLPLVLNSKPFYNDNVPQTRPAVKPSIRETSKNDACPC